MGLATSRQIASVSVHTVHRVVRQRREEGWDSFGRKPSRPGRPLQSCVPMPLGENLSKYLHQNFGLDSLPDHRLEALDPQERVVNLAQHVKARLERLQPTEADELQLEIERLHNAPNGIEDCRKRTPRHVPAGELPQDLRYLALAKRMRYLMDTLRMLAYRAELEPGKQLTPHLSKPETAQEAVRHTLFASEASLVRDHRSKVVKVHLLHQSRNWLDEAPKPLLAELNMSKTVYPGTNLRLVYEFVSG